MKTNDPEQTVINRELFPLVNKNGQTTGSAPRSICHGDPSKLHPVVHCIVINSKGEWLLQLRSADKDIQPGKWDTSVGGHFNIGESSKKALAREISEEIGLEAAPNNYKFLYSYIMSSEIESEFVYTYQLTNDGPFKKQDEEIEELRFWTVDEINRKLGSGIFTPNFEDEFARFQQYTKNREKSPDNPS